MPGSPRTTPRSRSGWPTPAPRSTTPARSPRPAGPRGASPAPTAGSPKVRPMTVVVRGVGTGPFSTVVEAGRHTVSADEPTDVGGADTGLSPYDLLLGALGSCTVMTLRLYAARKGWRLDDVSVALAHDRIHAADCAEIGRAHV